MAKFEKGRPKSGGRKKGTPNKWNFLDIKEICAVHDYDPLIVLINLHKKVSNEMKARIAIAILPYTRSKPRIDVNVGGNLGGSNPLRNKTAEELIKLLPVTNANSSTVRSATDR